MLCEILSKHLASGLQDEFAQYVPLLTVQFRESQNERGWKGPPAMCRVANH